jgi:hypothetical protein
MARSSVLAAPEPSGNRTRRVAAIHAPALRGDPAPRRSFALGRRVTAEALLAGRGAVVSAVGHGCTPLPSRSRLRRCVASRSGKWPPSAWCCVAWGRSWRRVRRRRSAPGRSRRRVNALARRPPASRRSRSSGSPWRRTVARSMRSAGRTVMRRSTASPPGRSRPTVPRTRGRRSRVSLTRRAACAPSDAALPADGRRRIPRSTNGARSRSAGTAAMST